LCSGLVEIVQRLNVMLSPKVGNRCVLSTHCRRARTASRRRAARDRN
jgi:hypothetical protein